MRHVVSIEFDVLFDEGGVADGIGGIRRKRKRRLSQRRGLAVRIGAGVKCANGEAPGIGDLSPGDLRFIPASLAPIWLGIEPPPDGRAQRGGHGVDPGYLFQNGDKEADPNRVECCNNCKERLYARPRRELRTLGKMTG